MQTIIGIIIGLLVLTFLVVAHEFGHYLMAIKSGVKVNEFGIGFPPRAKAWLKNPEYVKWQEKRQKAKKSGKKFDEGRPKKWLKLDKSEWSKPQKTLVFSINWLPIGGFCAMDGESDADTKKGTFGATTFWQKTKILFGGVLGNWIVAFILLTILAVVGMPRFISNQFFIESDTRVVGYPVEVGEVMEDTPAEAGGLKAGDLITNITSGSGEYTVNSSEDLILYNLEHAGETVTYHVNRNGEEKTLKIALNDKDDTYQLGISMNATGQALYYSTWSAPIVGAVTTIQLTGETFRGLGEMVYNLCTGIASQFSSNDQTRTEGRETISEVGDSVSGPVGIIGILFPAFASAGFSNLAFLAAIISISLACMNVLPIPALDGGRWFMIAIARMRGHTLKKETEEKIVSRAFIFLLALIVIITVLDVLRLFK